MQDMPPVGGFPSIRIQRRLPSTGPTGVAIFAVGGAVMAYGYYQVGTGVREPKIFEQLNSSDKLELKAESTIPLVKLPSNTSWATHDLTCRMLLLPASAQAHRVRMPVAQITGSCTDGPCRGNTVACAVWSAQLIM